MNLTLNLSAEKEDRLRKHAAESGQSVDGFVCQLVEQAVGGLNGEPQPAFPEKLPSDASLAPFRREVAESGMTDEEFVSFFEGVRNEVYQEKHGSSGQDL